VQETGKILVIFGVIIVLLGLLVQFSDKIPLFGKLPGDILIKRGNFTFFAPIATSIIISLIITAVLNLIVRLKK